MKTLTDLSAYFAGAQPGINLDQAALQIAAIEFPDLDPRPSLDALDHIAAGMKQRLQGAGRGPEWISAANRFLFDELGFHGSTDDYYDPRNSCLNEVLRRRTGIPITLSVVYMEIARRLGVVIRGIGLPGHFVVEYDDGAFRPFLDPFHGGRLLTAAECLDIARGSVGEADADARVLAPVGQRQILVRMLNNLRAIYLRAGSFARAAEVLRLMILAHPDSPAERRQLQLIHRRRAERN